MDGVVKSSPAPMLNPPRSVVNQFSVPLLAVAANATAPSPQRSFGVTLVTLGAVLMVAITAVLVGEVHELDVASTQKVVVVAKTKAEAIKKAKQTTFYKHCGFKGAESHIDDKYGIDVDDIHNIEDILSDKFKSQYRLKITKTNTNSEDEKHIGYLKIDKISV